MFDKTVNLSVEADQVSRTLSRHTVTQNCLSRYMLRGWKRRPKSGEAHLLRKAARLAHTKEVATAMDAVVASSDTRLRLDHTCRSHQSTDQHNNVCTVCTTGGPNKVLNKSCM